MLLCSVTSEINGCVKFESNNNYHSLRKTILNADNLSAYDILYFPLGDENGGLCFNVLNILKLNLIPI